MVGGSFILKCKLFGVFFYFTATIIAAKRSEMDVVSFVAVAVAKWRYLFANVPEPVLALTGWVAYETAGYER